MTNKGSSNKELLDQIKVLVDGCFGADQDGLRKRVRRIEERMRAGKPVDKALPLLINAVEVSAQRVEQRKARSVRVDYPEALPISAHVNELKQAIAEHQVVIVAGETGSGKTTQLPKVLLDSGFGIQGLIGVTQPRRLAARTIADRLAEELQVEGGDLVASQVRFDDQSSANTQIKVMTDGILLAEASGDPDLRNYDAIVLDEAHERSLNIDFLLGILKRVLQRRPELKLLVTSATIDTDRFSRFFDDAPVFEVSGRGYPVDIIYRPLDEDRDLSLPAAIGEAVDELNTIDRRGDVLVFLPGERDIREVANELQRRHLRNTEVLPLFARLSAAEQRLIFHPGRARRIVLATNVAETSLTVPRIKFVIDSGLARISRYSHRTKVQRLPIEAVSQASANQRSGRCGRLGPGTAIRLYSEDDLVARPQFTEPEIQRTSLAAVLLRMAVLKLGRIEDFPLVDPPAPQLIKDGYQLLRELGAFDAKQQLTSLGWRLGQLSVDPRLGRILIEAEGTPIFTDALTIAAGLSIADPRERPMDMAAKADEAHANFADPRSDFASLCRLYLSSRMMMRELSSNQYRKWCKRHFLSWMRLREWHDLRKQLAADMQGKAELRLPKPGQQLAMSDDATVDVLHRCVLSGFLSQVGLKTEEGDYTGARQRRFSIFPGSVLFNKGPKWVVVGQLMETSRTFGLYVGAVRPDWVEKAAADLVKRHVFDPHWSRKSGRVAAYEQITLFGLVLVERRRIDFSKEDPAAARALFIRAALVEGDIELKPAFFAHNQQLRESVEDLEDRQRRRDLLVHDSELAAFYEQRLPPSVTDKGSLLKWLKSADESQLMMEPEALLAQDTSDTVVEQFPDTLHINDRSLPLSYRFEPGTDDDGVSVDVPLALLNQLDEQRIDWLVPGLIEEKVDALIRSLPKARRRLLVPVPDYARAVMESLSFAQGDLKTEMASELSRIRGDRFEPDEFNPEGIADHLRMNIRLFDDQGTLLTQGRDLAQLRASHGDSASRSLVHGARPKWMQERYQCWPPHDLPASIEIQGVAVTPVFSDLDDGIEIALVEDEETAQIWHAEGVTRLIMLSLSAEIRQAQRQYQPSKAAAMSYMALGSIDDLREELAWRVSHDLVRDHPLPRSASEFATLLESVRSRLIRHYHRIFELVNAIVAEFGELRRLIKRSPQLDSSARTDLTTQLGYLVYEGFVGEVAYAFLQHYPRYLDAVRRRLQARSVDPVKDAERQALVETFWLPYLDLCESGVYPAAMAQLHEMIEEYRVSLFAQALRTAQKVSPKRLSKQLAQAAAAVERKQ
ncbi:MAG: ATP-dependent helicase [Lysobacteraceae bacterium]|nr:MAG: ATP-dependent helicase [Xanthomonadaceae bacterium]